MIVLDVEILHPVEELPDRWGSTDQMGVACACLYDFDSDRFRLFGPNDVARHRGYVSVADAVVSYNGYAFDMPVIYGVRKAEFIAGQGNTANGGKKFARLDLLRQIWIASRLDPDCFSPRTHGGTGLDVIARATLGRGKIGHGVMAHKLFAEGRWAEVATYCMDDVTLTRDLYLFAKKYGYVVAGDGSKVRLSF